jgi:hypothetical protein
MKMAVIWVVALHSLVEVHQRFVSACCLYCQGDGYPSSKADTSETSVNFYQSARSNNPGDSHLLWQYCSQTTVTNRTEFLDDIRRRTNSGNPYHYSVRTIIFHLLSEMMYGKNALFIMGMKICFCVFREDHKI